MNVRVKTWVALVAAMAIVGSGCGQQKGSVVARNVAPTHCIQPVVQSDSSDPTGYSTQVITCSDAAFVAYQIGNGSGAGGFDQTPSTIRTQPGGVGLPTLDPYGNKNSQFDPLGLAAPEVPSLYHVVALDATGQIVEWTVFARQEDGSLNVRYFTPAPASPDDLKCLEPASVIRMPFKLTVFSPCTDIGSFVLFRDALGYFATTPHSIDRNQSDSANFASLAVLVNAAGNPTEGVGFTETETSAKGNAFTFVDAGSAPLSPVTVTATPMTTPIDSSTPTDQTDDGTPTEDTTADSAPTDNGTPSDSTINAISDNTTSASVASEAGLDNVSRKLQNACRDFSYTISPMMPAKSTDTVVITPVVKCTIDIPEGYWLSTEIFLRNLDQGRSAGVLISPRTGISSFSRRLVSGNWDVYVSTFVNVTTGDDRSVGYRIGVAAHQSIQIVKDDSFPDCNGLDFEWNGTTLSSDCLRTHNITAEMQYDIEGGRRSKSVSSSDGAFTPSLTRGYNPVSITIPRSEDDTEILLMLCKENCDDLPSDFNGIDVVKDKDRSFHATIRDGCDGTYAMSVAVDRGNGLISFVPRLAANGTTDSGADDRPSQWMRTGGMDAGAFVKLDVPGWANIVFVGADCGDGFVYSFLPVASIKDAPPESPSDTSTDSTDVFAATDGATGDGLSVVIPVVEVPSRSMTGQPITVTDSTESVGIRGLDILTQPGIESATVTIDDSAPVRISLFGTTRIPLQKGAKELTVTYTKKDGSEVVVTKTIVNVEKAMPSPSSSTSTLIIVIVPAAIVLWGAGILLRRRRGQPKIV